MTWSQSLVLGVDAGGSSVRVVVADLSGRRLGVGRAAGANPVTWGPVEASARIEAAVRVAVSTVDASQVGRVALGLAGQGAFPPAALAATLDPMWRRCGLTCPWAMYSDLEVAFAAASPEPDGLVVLSGTGATVGEIRHGRLGRYLDGAGWLAGDVGSGFWLGLRAARAAVADLDGRAESTALTAAVCEHLGVAMPPKPTRAGEGSRAIELVAAIYRREPVRLAELAPLVLDAAAAADAVATRLVERAAAALLDSVALVLRDATDLRQVALAGGVLLADGPLRVAVRRGLVERWGVTPGDARDGAAGAAWCARRELDDPADATAAAHRRLTSAE